MNNRSTKALFGFALGLLLVGAGCAQPATAPAPEATDAMEKTDGAMMPKEDAAMEKTDGAMMPKEDAAMMGALKEVRLTAKQFSFTPSEVRVKQGERVKLIVTNEDVSHGIAIPAFNVNLTLEPGKTGTAEFVADKKGSFPFFCNVFCGSGQGGMKGTLIVE